MISIGIVLTVVFGSASQNNQLGNGTTAPRTGQPHASDLSKNFSATFLNYAINGGMGG